MEIIIFQALGGFSFTVATILLGIVLRKKPVKEMAEKTSRISHFFYNFGLALPGLIGMFYPGLTHFDETIGIKSLPFRSVSFILGVSMTLTGTYLIFVSIRAIKNIGHGAPSFKLTKKIVDVDIYKRVRNPMSSGYYLLCTGISLAAGSTYLTIGSIIISLIHMFNLKYFEELELEVRYGEPYIKYKQNTPFLIPKFKSG
ncbi:MAG: hypothetical protein HY776_03160 [Actinobacteria bacterium]|nr:hypothetical protein [Actinomycetota bacterium]